MGINQFLSKAPFWVQEGLKAAPPSYLNILKKISQQSLMNLLYIFNEFNKLKITGFGYRCFWPNGETSIFSLNKDWHELTKRDGFIDLNKAHISSELTLSITNQINLLTRSGDKIENEYLTLLNTTSVNNGILIYNYSPSRIEVFFLNCALPVDRDILVNKVGVIQQLINFTNGTFRKIIDSKEMYSERLLCLTPEQIKLCFKHKAKSSLIQQNTFHVIVKNKTLKLSRCDLECLYFLQFGSSVTHIAKCLGRSTFTIKDRIESLKNKFNVYSKKELMQIAIQDLGFLVSDSAQNNLKLINNSNIKNIL